MSPDYSLVWLDRRGNREPILTGIEEEINAPQLSPDGRRTAMGMGATALSSTQLWIYEIGDGALNPLTTRSESAWESLYHLRRNGWIVSRAAASTHS